MSPTHNHTVNLTLSDIIVVQQTCNANKLEDKNMSDVWKC